MLHIGQGIRVEQYRTTVIRAYGNGVDLPSPVGFRLPTEILKTYVR
ncbi:MULTISPECIES: hypothetical protein [unclassified Kitasatospora]|nr:MULTISPECIES: hypothetical protein [unclassified Kitasatospora]